jgi:hypothetical protein
LYWRWLPFVTTRYQPSSSINFITSRVFIATLLIATESLRYAWRRIILNQFTGYCKLEYRIGVDISPRVILVTLFLTMQGETDWKQNNRKSARQRCVDKLLSYEHWEMMSS